MLPYAQKSELVRIAQNTAGVVGVSDELSVVPTESVADKWIACSINEAVARNQLVDPDNVTVRVSNGKVVLSGMVADYRAWQETLASAKNIAGVSKVNDNLQVRSLQ